jgi:hypothetical protein
MNNPAARIYYGVPRFVGELFRATRAPSIILLIGFVVVPLGIAIYLNTSAVRNHSILPLNLWVVGFLQFRIENDPSVANNLPPHMAELLRTMTPEQKELGKQIFEYFTVLNLILAAALIWWFVRFFRFVAGKATRKAP